VLSPHQENRASTTEIMPFIYGIFAEYGAKILKSAVALRNVRLIVGSFATGTSNGLLAA
jgi:hypothetical protein